MKGIMFNTKYGLEQSVLKELKTRTWRADKKPRYEVGEIVAIKQCYTDVMNYSFYNDKKLYDKVCNLMNEVGSTNKMFVKNELMPHKIKITKVTPCKLQDITEDECMREGIDTYGIEEHYVYDDFNSYRYIDFIFNFPNSKKTGYPYRLMAFADLINKLNGKGYWESNPDGYAYEFELIK